MNLEELSDDEQKSTSMTLMNEEYCLPETIWSSYCATLTATGILLPGVATLSTLLIFLAPCKVFCEDRWAPFWGSGITLLLWLILTIFFRRFTDARYAIPSSYGELCYRLAQLKSQMSVVCRGNAFLDDTCKSTACEQIRTQIKLIEKELVKGGVSWASARGYINVWNRLHRAEEAMIEVEPQETAIAGALTDVLRLQGSKIDQREDLTAQIRQAVEIIDSSAMRYLQGTTATPLPLAIPAPPPAAAGIANASNSQSTPIRQARAILRDTRYAINEFRDGLWNGLIVARNRLIATMFYTGTTAYVLLAIAIIRGAEQSAIAAVSVYYLVGATIGLLNHLVSVSQNDTAVEDYGLSMARLITMPLICGLAAIGGVFLVAMPQVAGSYSAETIPLAITTPSELESGTPEQVYHQKIEATGGTPPYMWNVSNGSLPEGMRLETTGDLIAKLPKEIDSTKPVKFTAQVTDKTEFPVEKTFFLEVTSAAKGRSKQQSSSQSAAASTLTNSRSLEEIFNLNKNIIGLILAAVFGLTPGLFFDRLQQQSEKYKADLKGSESTQTTPKSPK